MEMKKLCYSKSYYIFDYVILLMTLDLPGILQLAFTCNCGSRFLSVVERDERKMEVMVD
jgi:hypothetical protein